MANGNENKTEKSFRAQWSEPLAKKGFTQISNVFLENYHKLGISTQQAMFLIHLFRYKWTVNQPYPSLDTIAMYMGKSSDVVHGYARALENLGIIKRTFRTGNTNLYSLNPLIHMLEDTVSPVKIHTGALQKTGEPSVNLQTKEDPLRIQNKDSDIKSIGELLREKQIRINTS